LGLVTKSSLWTTLLGLMDDLIFHKSKNKGLANWKPNNIINSVGVSSQMTVSQWMSNGWQVKFTKVKPNNIIQLKLGSSTMTESQWHSNGWYMLVVYEGETQHHPLSWVSWMNYFFSQDKGETQQAHQLSVNICNSVGVHPSMTES
jgi:hypothetical protein